MTINFAKIQELRELDDDGSDSVLKELIGLYMNSTPPKIKKMVESFYTKDFSTLKKEAHSLRSSSLTVGADALSQVAYDIEYVKEEGNFEEFLHEQIIKLNKEFEAVKTELTKFL